jgi:hypothetical protein
MTQEEVENIFGVKPEDRKAPDPNLGGMWPPRPHDGVMRYTGNRRAKGTHIGAEKGPTWGKGKSVSWGRGEVP